MNELDIQIQNLEKRLKQKKEAKRKAEAKDRAKEQRELDRRNLLLGRALTESCNAVHFAKFRRLRRYCCDQSQVLHRRQITFEGRPAPFGLRALI